MPDISRITLPSGTTYNIKDEDARKLIAALSSATRYLGVTTTALSDGVATTPIAIGDKSVIPKGGDIAAYGNSEYIWSDIESKWRELGSTGSLKALAFKDSASADYTPSGSVSAPEVTVTPNTTSVTPFKSAGSLPKCTLPKMTATVTGETLALGWSDGLFDAGTLPSGGSAVTVATGIKSATASAPKFSGTAAKITVE